MRPHLLKIMHQNCAPQMDLEQFAINMGEWELIPVITSDVIVGVVAENNGEIHLAIDSKIKVKSRHWRKHLNQIIEPIIDRYGYVTTRVESDDHETRKFVHRLGFKDYSSLGNITTYAMSQIKHRRFTCQQQS